MVTGFEDYTAPLSEHTEKVIVPLVCTMLEGRKGVENAITNKTLREWLAMRGHSVSDTEIRAIINHIRLNGKVRLLLASSKGYYQATTLKEVEEYCRSLSQRSNAILAVKLALQEQIMGRLFL